LSLLALNLAEGQRPKTTKGNQQTKARKKIITINEEENTGAP
jgi:hypothetical protein